MRICCLTHVPFEGPAAIAEWAALRGHTLDVTPLYEPGISYPEDTEFLVIMGGPMSIDQEAEHPWLAEEKRFVARAIANGARVLGVCLGAQLLAEVLGGSVMRGAHAEIGWYPVELTPEGRKESVFGALPEHFDALHWHGDTFAVPPKACHVASSEACANQAFACDAGRVVGLQFHLEETRDSLTTLIDHAADDLTDGPWISSAEGMLKKPERFERSRELLFGLLDAMTVR